jgi:hypothetical protein
MTSSDPAPFERSSKASPRPGIGQLRHVTCNDPSFCAANATGTLSALDGVTAAASALIWLVSRRTLPQIAPKSVKSAQQQVLDVAEAEGESGIEPDGVLDDYGWEAISGVADLGHIIMDAYGRKSPPTSPTT